jgi:hypothetical protein
MRIFQSLSVLLYHVLRQAVTAFFESIWLLQDFEVAEMWSSGDSAQMPGQQLQVHTRMIFSIRHYFN